jgi:NAD(P)-dependent dehydrogenase (short-subunit alcohol dehydrogenase family)
VVVAEEIKPSAQDLARDGRIVRFVGDVSQEETAQRVVELAVERFGKLDILVNNAARIIYKPVADMPLAEWDAILSVNLTGVFLHSREAFRARTRTGGAIVNVGSYACFFGFPQIGAYAASMGGLVQLTRVLAVENIKHGIWVNAVGSGDVVTDLLNDFMPDGRESLANHGKNAPIGRAARPEEIAEVIALLASEKASFLVGPLSWPTAVSVSRSADRDVTAPKAAAVTLLCHATTKAALEKFFGDWKFGYRASGCRVAQDRCVATAPEGLESFRASNGKVTLDAAVAFRDGTPQVRIWKNGQDNEPPDSKSPFWMKIRGSAAMVDRPRPFRSRTATAR